MLIENKTKKAGFSLLELLLTIAIFSAVSISAGYLIIDASTTTDANSKKIEATLLAKEGIEATRSIRDANGFSGLSNGDYGLAFNTSSDTWYFSGGSDITDSIYTRSVHISDGRDSHTKVVTSTVTAQSGSRNVSVSLTTELTSWRE